MICVSMEEELEHGANGYYFKGDFGILKYIKNGGTINVQKCINYLV